MPFMSRPLGLVLVVACGLAAACGPNPAPATKASPKPKASTKAESTATPTAGTSPGGSGSSPSPAASKSPAASSAPGSSPTPSPAASGATPGPSATPSVAASGGSSPLPTPLATALAWRNLAASDGVAAGFKAELLPLDALAAPAAGELGHRVAIAKDGTIYLYDPNGGNGRVLRLLTDGKLEVFAASAAVSDMAVAADGKLFVGAGTDLTTYTLDANKRAQAAAGGKLPEVCDSIALGSDGTIYASAPIDHVIYKLTPGAGATPAVYAGKVNTFATSTQHNDGVGELAQFGYPRGLALDAGNTLYVADEGNGSLRKINPANVGVTTLAGEQTGATFKLTLDKPADLAVASDGTVYLLDGGSTRRQIRAISSAGKPSNVFTAPAGTPASNDMIARSLKLDDAGTLYFVQRAPAGLIRVKKG